ncbi:MAG: tRNA adenosine(34) deaminase TadA [Pseudomonadales bacterium]
MAEPDDLHWMQVALELAAKAAALGEVPVGAVVVRDGEVIGAGYNRPISSSDPCAHAEIIALRDAAQREANYRLPGASLYVTIEPCTMCAGAAVHARVDRVIFGATEPKAGVVVSNTNLLAADYLNHHPRWLGGVLEKECGELVSSFFAKRRLQKREAK